MDTKGKAIKDWLRYVPYKDLGEPAEYLISESDFEDSPGKLFKMAQYFIQQHREKELPRLELLFNYYVGKTNILYREMKKTSKKADNRIPSGIPKYIVDTHTGYVVGNPIQYKRDNESNLLADKLEQLNKDNAESYHEKMLVKNVLICGKGYDIVYIKELTNDIRFKNIDPRTCFVVYDDSLERKSLFAVRYYVNQRWTENTQIINEEDCTIEVYTDTRQYTFNSSGAVLSDEENLFGKIPITEYGMSAEGRGIYESSLPRIDALELIISEMVNSEQDFANSTLLVVGDFAGEQKEIEIEEKDPKTGKPIKVKVLAINTDDNILHLKPSYIKGLGGEGVKAVTPTAQYLTKNLNASEWKQVIDELRDSILHDTHTPNTLDKNFGGNSSGVAMSYKLWGADQEQSIQQEVFSRGIARRLYLIYLYLSKLTEDKYKEADLSSISIVFTPNLPKNDQEIIGNIQSLYQTGVVSERTLAEMASTVTGVSADTEIERLNDDGGISIDTDEAIGITDGTESYHQAVNDFFGKVRDDGE